MTLKNADKLTIPRHKAALKRQELSLPMAATVDAGDSITPSRTLGLWMRSR